MFSLASIRSYARRLIQGRGFSVCPYPLKKYFDDFGIDLVLDVGANVGQYATEIRGLGYRGRIESFEPMEAAFKVLEQRARFDKQWNVHHFALGDVEDQGTLSISANGPSSSFLPLSPDAAAADVNIAYVATEDVRIRRLDSLFAELRRDSKHVFLKVDTQGFEKNVIDGAASCLSEIDGVQIELSLTRQYDGELLASEFLELMGNLGFIPYWFIHGYRSRKTMQLKQVDVVFFRDHRQ